MTQAQVSYKVSCPLVLSRNFILGGKLTDHVAVYGTSEGRVDFIIIIIGNILGGGGGGGGGSWVSLGGGGRGGEVGSVWGGGEVELLGGEASPVPPSLDETLLRYTQYSGVSSGVLWVLQHPPVQLNNSSQHRKQITTYYIS